ncbi:MAG: acyltransferase family protein [Verrucomicrobiota bacterium]
MAHSPTSAVSGTPSRLAGLDALRVFDMFWICGADAFGHAFLKAANGPVSHGLAEQFEHVAWQGFRFYDLIFPLFVFISGISIVLSRNAKPPTGDRGQAFLGIAKRAGLLYLLGVFFYRGYSGWENDIRYLGVLQRIALCYFSAATLHLFLSPRALKVTVVGILLGYWGLMTLVPVPGVGPANLQPDTNLAHWVDAQFLGGKKWNGAHDPEGLLSTLPAIASCLLGVLTGLFLKAPNRTATQRLKGLTTAGLALLATGYLWGMAFPIIKNLWTSSYVCVAAGWSCLILALFHGLIDVKGWSGWAKPFTWIGMNSIAIYLASNLADFGKLARRLTGGEVTTLLEGLHPGTAGVVSALVSVGFCIWLAWLLHGRRIFLRV